MSGLEERWGKLPMGRVKGKVELEKLIMLYVQLLYPPLHASVVLEY